MRKIVQIVGLALILCLTVVACNDCEKDCNKDHCDKKDKMECKHDGKKACCAGKSDSASMDGSMEEGMQGDAQAHVCTEECESNPTSCPNHMH